MVLTKLYHDRQQQIINMSDDDNYSHYAQMAATMQNTIDLANLPHLSTDEDYNSFCAGIVPVGLAWVDSIAEDKVIDDHGTVLSRPLVMIMTQVPDSIFKIPGGEQVTHTVTNAKSHSTHFEISASLTVNVEAGCLFEKVSASMTVGAAYGGEDTQSSEVTDSVTKTGPLLGASGMPVVIHLFSFSIADHQHFWDNMNPDWRKEDKNGYGWCLVPVYTGVRIDIVGTGTDARAAYKDFKSQFTPISFDAVPAFVFGQVFDDWSTKGDKNPPGISMDEYMNRN